MKKLILAVLSLSMTLGINAQKVVSGSTPSLKGEKKINLVINYSQTTIDKKDIADWLEYRQAQQPDYDAKNEWENELKPALTEAFTNNVNKKIEKQGAYLVVSPDANYTLTVYPQNVEKKGNNTNICTITDKSGKEIIRFEVKGSGGTFGSMSNLWGDGYEDTGKKVGSFLAKFFKK